MDDVDSPTEDEALVTEESPTPVGVVMFDVPDPDGLLLLSNKDGSMVLVRVKELLNVLVTRATDELELATLELALATPVPMLIGGK